MLLNKVVLIDSELELSHFIHVAVHSRQDSDEVVHEEDVAEKYVNDNKDLVAHCIVGILVEIEVLTNERDKKSLEGDAQRAVVIRVRDLKK